LRNQSTLFHFIIFHNNYHHLFISIKTLQLLLYETIKSLNLNGILIMNKKICMITMLILASMTQELQSRSVPMSSPFACAASLAPIASFCTNSIFTKNNCKYAAAAAVISATVWYAVKKSNEYNALRAIIDRQHTEHDIISQLQLKRIAELSAENNDLENLQQGNVDRFNQRLRELQNQLGSQQEKDNILLQTNHEFLQAFNNQKINPFHDDIPGFPALSKLDPATEMARLEQFTTIDATTIENDQLIINPPARPGVEEKNSSRINKTTARHTISPRYNTDNYPGKRLLNSPNEKPNVIILKAVHGTWSNANSMGEDLEKEMSQHLTIFAQKLAIVSGATVYFDSFSWSAELSKDQRAEAGTDLMHEIMTTYNEHKAHANVSVWAIGHSHGCNVIHHAAQQLKRSDISIDNAIFLASPILDIDPTTTDSCRYNIKSLINIWGSSDATGPLGSLLSTLSTLTMRKDHSLDNKELVRNVILKHNGKDLNHSSGKYIGAQFLAGIIQYLGNEFTGITNMILNIAEKTSQDESEYAGAGASSDDMGASGILVNLTDCSHSSDEDQTDSSLPSPSQTPSPSPSNTSHASRANQGEDTEEEIITMADTEKEHEIKGVIDQKEPLLQHAHLQNMLLPEMQSRLQKHKLKSREHEIEFENKYLKSIHDEPTIIRRALQNEIVDIIKEKCSKLLHFIWR